MASPKKKNAPFRPYSRPTVPVSESKPKGPIQEKEGDKALLGNNFLLVGIAGFMIILGFILISGSSSGVDEYNPGIYSTRRIVVGPTIAFLGFVLMAIAIIVKPKRLCSFFGRCRKGKAADIQDSGVRTEVIGDRPNGAPVEEGGVPTQIRGVKP